MGKLRLLNVSKAYKHYARKSGRVMEWLGFGQQHTPHWVLRDIAFDVAAGESVGVIGVNGAGKSTLLKIIAGTTQPTTGQVEVEGRLAALLELGMGFHPEFTGRQNVFMAGQLRGMDRDLVAAKMAEIEAFADIGAFIDEPVRIYSTGMQVRLAFAVVTAVRPEILIVDEALAVGDIFFQQKCFDRIRKFKEEGTTLLFVTHSMGTVYSLCDRAILLEGGRIYVDDVPKAAIDVFNATLARQRLATLGTASPPPLPRHRDEPRVPAGAESGTAGEGRTDAIAERTTAPATGPAPAPHPVAAAAEAPPALVDDPSAAQGAASFAHPGVAIESVTLLVGDEPAAVIVSEAYAALRVRVRFASPFADPHVGFQIRDRLGVPIFMTNTYCMARSIGAVAAGTTVTVEFSMQLAIAPGDYTITVGVANEGAGEGQFREPLARQQSATAITVLRNLDSILWTGYSNLFPRVSIERTEHAAA
jgi:lipopolysaccharide transport system ATP-binding protein